MKEIKSQLFKGHLCSPGFQVISYTQNLDVSLSLSLIYMFVTLGFLFASELFFVLELGYCFCNLLSDL